MTVNLGRICEHFARITLDSVDSVGGVDQQSTRGGSAKTLQGSHETVFILVGVDQQSTWEGSSNTLQVFVERGSIDSQLGKDP